MSVGVSGLEAAAGKFLVGAACAPLILSAFASAPPQDPTQDLPATEGLLGRINRAIDRGVEKLACEQHRDGSWTGPRFGAYRAGPTALAAYALVESGVPASSPSIQLALDFLLKTPPVKTYSAGCLMLLLAEVDAEGVLTKDLKFLAQDTLEKLISWESSSLRGSWGYPAGQVDLSNTQFAALGFWAGSKMGFDVPLDVTQRMVMTTISKHQEDASRSPVELASRKGKSRAGGSKIAGYMYLPNKKQPATASMTVAGLCVQQIARELFGRKLGRKVLKASDASEALGMGWLEAHWSVTENYDKGADQLLYYLWGMERLAAFLDTDELVGHRWYEEGAIHILDLEKDATGSWGLDHETAYALLFLRRATRAASSGSRPKGATSSWLQGDGPVSFRVTGTSEVTAFLVGLERKDPVTRVEWLMDGATVETVESSSPRRPWKGERFAVRWTPEPLGKHSLVARVHYADGPPVDSGALEFVSRVTYDDWAAAAAEEWFQENRAPNLLDSVKVTFEGSSFAPGQEAPRAADGLEGTVWIAEAADKHPRLQLTLDAAVPARTLTVSHAASKVAALGQFAGASRIAVTLNGKGDPLHFDLPPQSAATIALELPKKTRVRSLTIEVLETQGKSSGKVGFAEIGLR